MRVIQKINSKRRGHHCARDRVFDGTGGWGTKGLVPLCPSSPLAVFYTVSFCLFGYPCSVSTKSANRVLPGYCFERFRDNTAAGLGTPGGDKTK